MNRIPRVKVPIHTFIRAIIFITIKILRLSTMAGVWDAFQFRFVNWNKRTHNGRTMSH